jgi:hypothetical protein
VCSLETFLLLLYKGVVRKYVLFNDWQLKIQLRPLFQLLAEVRKLKNANSGDSRSFLFLLCSVVTPIPWYKQSSLSSKLGIIKRKVIIHNMGTETKLREDAEITNRKKRNYLDTNSICLTQALWSHFLT